MFDEKSSQQPEPFEQKSSLPKRQRKVIPIEREYDNPTHAEVQADPHLYADPLKDPKFRFVFYLEKHPKVAKIVDAIVPGSEQLRHMVAKLGKNKNLLDEQNAALTALYQNRLPEFPQLIQAMSEARWNADSVPSEQMALFNIWLKENNIYVSDETKDPEMFILFAIFIGEFRKKIP